MQPVEIRPSIYWVGVNDRSSELFEGLWPIRNEGISYNSYLINDKKKAMIDLSCQASTDELLDHISAICDPASLDYIVINHMEPDHSGALKALLRLAPQVKLVGTDRTADMLNSFYGITRNVMTVSDGDTLDLGTHKLKFIATPFVHWPETMMTYETTQEILFSCDGFGGYGTLNGSIFDDPGINIDWYEEQALRYFVNVIATFARAVRTAVAKLGDLPISVVAPAHGLIWRDRPQRIIDLYDQWAGYATAPGDLGVTLIYASMYGNTEKMMDLVAQGIMDEGVPVSIFNTARIHASYILPSLWLKRGVLIGAPTYEGGLFPDVANVLEMALRKHIYNRTAAGFGSRAWSGGGQRELEQATAALKWDFTCSLEWHGAPSPANLEKARQFGADFARELQISHAAGKNPVTNE